MRRPPAERPRGAQPRARAHTADRKTWPLVVAVVLIAVYLRAPITGIGSLVNLIASDLGLSASATGMLTTIPLLAFGVVSLFIGAFARRVGAGYALATGLVVALAGILCRSFLGTAGLFAGTVAIGCGIAVGNVLLPAIIKKFFPDRIWFMTSLYTTVMTGMGGVSAAIGMPLARAFGWQGALAVWALTTALALIWWMPWRAMRLGAGGGAREAGSPPVGRAGSERPQCESAPIGTAQMARHPMAWAVALYMGSQSLLFYCFVAWFSPVLQSQGMDAGTAGLLNSLYLFLGVPGSLSVPLLARRFSSQSAVGAGVGVVYLVGMVAFAFSQTAPALVVCLLCCGYAQGACISFAMAQFGVHTRNPQEASALSAFGQSVGYLVAAVGPVLLGRLVDASGSWASSHVVLIAVALLVAVLGWAVGRKRVIGG